MLRGLDMPIDLKDDEQRAVMQAAIKAAIESWLDTKLAMVGKWTLRGIAAAALAALTHWIINSGWIK